MREKSKMPLESITEEPGPRGAYRMWHLYGDLKNERDSTGVKGLWWHGGLGRGATMCDVPAGGRFLHGVFEELKEKLW